MRYNYSFFENLPEKLYPAYMSKFYNEIMKEKLDLRKPKTFTQKIQWLKLYDSPPPKNILC